ncbi:MAG: tetratricopeptide repeat protein [Bacteroidota bacterium]
MQVRLFYNLLYCSICLLAFTILPASAADNKTDSLNKALVTAKNPAQHARTLIELSRETFKSAHDTSKSLPIMRQAIAEAIKAGNDTILNTARYYTVYQFFKINSYETALGLIDKLDARYLTIVKNPGAEKLGMKGEALYNLSRNAESIKECLLGLKAIHDTSDHTCMGELHLTIGLALGMTGNGPEILVHYKQALREFELSRDTWDIGRGNFSLGSFYAQTGKPELAEKHNLAALSNFKKCRNLKGVADVLGNLGAMQIDKGNYSKAEEYFNEKSVIRRDSMHKSPPSGEMGQFFVLFWKWKKYDRAHFYLDKADSIARSEHDWVHLVHGYLYKSLMYEETGDIKAGMKYLKMHYALKDSVYTLENEKILHDSYTKYKTELKEAENKALMKDVELGNNRRTMLIICIIALVCFIMLLFFIYRIKAKANAAEALRIQNEHDLIKRASVAEQQALNATLIQKNDLLNNLTGYMLQRNEVIAEVKNGIINLPVKDKALQKMADDLDMLMDAKGEWEEFVRAFEAVNPGFADRLYKLSPELTLKELKMCTYIRMNLDVKQIASMLNVTDPSVHNFRTRLRKKLGLEPGADLNSVLMAL